MRKMKKAPTTFCFRKTEQDDTDKKQNCDHKTE